MSIYFSLLYLLAQVIVETIQLSNNSSLSLVRKLRQNQMDQMDGVEYSYRDVHRWNQRWPQCGGRLQSPISLTPSSCRSLGGWESRLEFGIPNARPLSVNLMNNGHTVKYVFTWNPNAIPTISGGPLGSTRYIPHEVHFHWTNRWFGGSEHALYDMRFTMEMHIVCYNAVYRNLQNAMNASDGVMVLGQMYQKFILGEHYSFLELLPQVQRRGSNITITRSLDAFTLDSFLNVNIFNEFFVIYLGSLTTPPCREGILWIVNVLPKLISVKSMNFFRRLEGMDRYIEDNVRPLQPRNQRACYTNSIYRIK
ncbi:hypothetical protein DMENIID0001_100490 [Sergentomyia squamirostris]